MSPVASKTAIKFTGLSTYPNALGQAQPGALQRADNVCIDRPGVITPREGRNTYTVPGAGPPIASRLFQVEQALYGYFTADGLPASSGQLARLDPVNASDFIAKTISPPPGNAIHSFQENSSTFLTTDDGIYKLMAKYSVGDTPGALVPAGMPYGLDGQGGLTPPANGSQGFLQGNYVTGYQYIIGSTDANGVEVLGAPSPMWIVSNPAYPNAGSSVVSAFIGIQTFTVTLPAIPAAGGTARAYMVQGSTVQLCNVTFNNFNTTATVLLDGNSVQFFGPTGTTVTIVLLPTIDTVSGGTTLNFTNMPGNLPAVGDTVYQPVNAAAPSSLASAAVVSTIASVTPTSITVAGGTFTAGTPTGILIPATVATAQTFVVEVAAGATAFRLGDQITIPGASGLYTILANAISGSFRLLTLDNFPVGANLLDNGKTPLAIYRSENVTSTFVLPAAVQDYFNTDPSVAVFWQLYRSATQIPLTAGAVASPGANMAQVGQGVITEASYGASKIVTFVDVAPDATLGTALYTSPNQEGAGAAQYQPPVASDAALYQNCAMYANVYLPASYSTQLLATADLPTTPTVAKAGSVGFTMQQISLGAVSLTGIAVGQYVTGPGIPAYTYVTGTANVSGNNFVFINNFPTSTTSGTYSFFTLSTTAFQPGDTVTVNGVSFMGVPVGSTPSSTQFIVADVASAGSISAAVNATVTNLSRAVNAYTVALTAPGDTKEQVSLLSTSTALQMAGNFVVQATRGLGTFTLSTSRPGAFTQMPTAALSPTNQGNMLYYSPPNQPEAVPLLNSLAVGTANYPIRRILSLPGSLIAFKDDGIYQLTGTSADQFTVSVLNTTAQLLANETAVALQSSVFAFTTKGIVSVTSSGPQIASMAINSDLLGLVGLPAFASTAFAVADETKNRYMLWAPTTLADTLPTQAYVYNVLTNAWTRWLVPATCGLVAYADDALYVGAVDTSPVLTVPAVYRFTSLTIPGSSTAPQFNYGDETVTGTINMTGTVGSFTAASINPASIVGAFTCPGSALRLGTDPTPGPVVYPTAMAVGVESITMNFTAADAAQITDGQTCTLVQSYDTVWAPIPIVADEAGAVKQFQEFTLTYLGATNPFVAATMQTDLGASYRSVPLAPIAQTRAAGGFGGETFGGAPFGGVPNQSVIQPASARQFVTTPANRGRSWWPTVTAPVAANYFAVEGLTLNWLPLQTTRTR